MLLASEVTKTMLYGVFARSERSACANSWMAESEVSGICPCARALQLCLCCLRAPQWRLCSLEMATCSNLWTSLC